VGPIQGSIVNWYGHKIGYQNFDNKDDSRNTLPIDFALMGELYQNNHHQNGNKINFATKWFELDLTYYIAIVLDKLGIITINQRSKA
jgi:stearoyl-CoA desaturase (delta-9 desaturase)